TSNIDIIDTLISSNHKIYSEILLRWLGCDIPIEQTTAENLLVRLFTCLSENAVYRLESTEEEVIFNQNSIYSALLDNEIGNIDIDGDGEAKGSLRVLKSLLSENLSRYLVYSSKSGVMWSDARYWNNDRAIFLENYQSRVDTYLQLNIGTIKTLLQTRQKPIETVKPAKTDTATAPRKTGGTNRLLYGIPGSGKSHQAAQLCPNAAQMERVVFHPEYSYSDFVGQIMPIVDENKRVYYGFTPGPFTRILQKAYNSPTAEFFLIIEELNRGNAPAIFGEIFQLLDRNEDGTSSYGITNAAIAEIVYENAEKLVFLPSNLHIVATMNTSDQNVFTLDTAFQRRWRMQLVENDVKTAAHASYKIPTTTITWEKFSTVINKFILENSTNLSSTEDKRLGAYFVTSQDLEPSESEVYENFDFFGENTEKAHRFAEKVLKYLWDDVFKFSRSTLFDTTKYPSLESVIKEFTANTGNERLTKIFASNVAEELVNNG
ncbi:MAG: AAA family ATPase, partial [Defluviitaleaceae bacterium]|nr:AAA family ATPase [Defluviitaleaceae bacterium]